MIGFSFSGALYLVSLFSGGPLNPCIALMQSLFQYQYLALDNQILSLFQLKPGNETHWPISLRYVSEDPDSDPEIQ